MKSKVCQLAGKPTVLRLASDPLAVMELEKIRISLTRQISHYGWRKIVLGLQAACEHGAAHQRANPPAAALWRWRAQMFGQLASQEVAPPENQAASPKPAASPRSSKNRRPSSAQHES